MVENSTAIEFPTIDWCFDTEIYYASAFTAIAAPLRKGFQSYKRFSYIANGLVTTVFAVFGLCGSMLLLLQICTSHLFSRRLAVHLGMICIWDSLYLISCLATYGIPSLIYGTPPTYGTIFSYVLFFLQPFASFCVSCTIWQVTAITVERYWAVTQPLEQRTRKARFGVHWICAGIIIGTFILNLLPVPFERHLVPCFEIYGNSFRYYTLLKPYDDTTSKWYRFVVHFFPDLVFRAPFPIILIAVLTMKTIYKCLRRTVGNQLVIQMNRNIPFRLTCLNFKFILCNTLYMVNTILIELLGYGESVDNNEEVGKVDRYINSYYLTDFSNLLLVLHSATNWLIFIQWPRWSARQQRSTNMSGSSTCRSVLVKPEVAQFVLERTSTSSTALGMNIVATLTREYDDFQKAINFQQSMECTNNNPDLTKIAVFVGGSIQQILKWFAARGNRVGNLRELGRRLGEAQLNAEIHFTPEQWKDIRHHVVSTITKHTFMDGSGKFSRSEVYDNLARAFNFVLSEMRSGTLCAAVEANKKTFRSHSACLGRPPVLPKVRTISQVGMKGPCEFPPLISSNSCDP